MNQNPKRGAYKSFPDHFLRKMAIFRRRVSALFGSGLPQGIQLPEKRKLKRLPEYEVSSLFYRISGR
ncbi:MAG: hypothetical protein Q4D81_15220, partial [Eubacteriales bacterium]|nr:hypothetical protein [Eubacteriales bacterium]